MQLQSKHQNKEKLIEIFVWNQTFVMLSFDQRSFGKMQRKSVQNNFLHRCSFAKNFAQNIVVSFYSGAHIILFLSLGASGTGTAEKNWIFLTNRRSAAVIYMVHFIMYGCKVFLRHGLMVCLYHTHPIIPKRRKERTNERTLKNHIWLFLIRTSGGNLLCHCCWDGISSLFLFFRGIHP